MEGIISFNRTYSPLMLVRRFLSETLCLSGYLALGLVASPRPSTLEEMLEFVLVVGSVAMGVFMLVVVGGAMIVFVVVVVVVVVVVSVPVPVPVVVVVVMFVFASYVW